MANSKRYYKLKKNDTLDALASKHKYKNWKQIWMAKENANLRKRRSKPEQLQAGDMVYMPVTDAERKHVDKTILELNLARNDLIVVRSDFEADIKRLEYNCTNLTRIVGEIKKVSAGMISEIKAAKKGIKKVSTAVDTAATLVNLTRSLTKLAQTGYKASKASGDALKKINKDLTKDVKKKIRDGHIDAARKMLVGLKDTSLEAIWIVNDSFDKMTSPSFWAMTFTQVWDGKSWSDAVTYDLDADFSKKIKRVERDRDTYIKDISAEIAKQKATIKTLQTTIKQVNLRIGQNEKAAVQLMEAIE
ncbi:hypothetical protein GV827_15205 [Sulfitobacter sp. JBTF-M27]|uniref:LysM domain-containing protein n=1 Tax=Sulfitobacter sediminilitoris TaxID=2698830 RepID=A0A6P0CF78_9RHOB|nr:hypothetical protein [Sulfitobacter sediminilitoris]NEK23745.1 hypothetical protein [Sulfitobacter sediminilitoris]